MLSEVRPLEEQTATLRAELETAARREAGWNTALRFLGVLEVVAGEGRSSAVGRSSAEAAEARAGVEAEISRLERERAATMSKIAGAVVEEVHEPESFVEATASLTRAWQEADPVRVAKVFEAMGLLGVPYRYGAAGPDAYDCSGFVVALFQPMHTRTIRHRSSSQRNDLPSVTRENLDVGDLVFFADGGEQDDGSGIGHVAVHIGAGMMVHATADKQKVTLGRFRTETPSRVAGFADPFPATPLP
jgi:peptidoglycan DL-endopeptidase CwlO